MSRSKIAFRLVGLALALAVTGCGYNQIQGADEDVKAAWAEIGNQYQRRMDLIPNLVNTVKGAANFEQETLQAVIEARASALQTRLDASVLDDPEAFQKVQRTQAVLGGALGRLFGYTEAYPDLKAVSAFRDLQAQIEGTENRIAVARRRYIEAVAAYNKRIRQFPGLIWARWLDLEVRPSLETPQEAEKVPEVQF
jgi:LemA protein